MKIATYNVNGVNGRLDVLLQWLGEARPDAVVLQELKAPDNKFPAKQLEAAGYGSVWHGQKSWNGVAILARGRKPLLTRKGLPGDPEDDQSRYIEAVVDGIVLGGLYLPNGNPRPGPKFDYKLRWLSRLNAYAADLLELGVPVILAGTSTSFRPILTSTSRIAGAMTPCFMRMSARHSRGSSHRDGQMQSADFIRTSGSTHSSIISATPSGATLAFVSIMFW